MSATPEVTRETAGWLSRNLNRRAEADAIQARLDHKHRFALAAARKIMGHVGVDESHRWHGSLYERGVGLVRTAKGVSIATVSNTMPINVRLKPNEYGLNWPHARIVETAYGEYKTRTASFGALLGGRPVNTSHMLGIQLFAGDHQYDPSQDDMRAVGPSHGVVAEVPVEVGTITAGSRDQKGDLYCFINLVEGIADANPTIRLPLSSEYDELLAQTPALTKH